MYFVWSSIVNTRTTSNRKLKTRERLARMIMREKEKENERERRERERGREVMHTKLHSHRK